MDQKTKDGMILLEHLPFETDRGIADEGPHRSHRARDRLYDRA